MKGYLFILYKDLEGIEYEDEGCNVFKNWMYTNFKYLWYDNNLADSAQAVTIEAEEYVPALADTVWYSTPCSISQQAYDSVSASIEWNGTFGLNTFMDGTVQYIRLLNKNGATLCEKSVTKTVNVDIGLNIYYSWKFENG